MDMITEIGFAYIATNGFQQMDKLSKLGIYYSKVSD